MPRKILNFAEIDNLFLLYKQACAIPNNTQFELTQKSKIIEELWRNLKTKSIYTKIEEFPDEMVKVTNKCIKTYKEKDSHQGFSKYTLKSIKDKLITQEINASFDERTKGMHISGNYKEIQRDLNKLYVSFLSFRKSSDSENVVNEKFVEYASKYLEIDRMIVIDFLKPKRTTSLEYSGSEDDDDSFDISDLFGGTEEFSPDLELEVLEKNKKIFSKINSEWKNQKEDSKPVMSELLTLVILEALDKGFICTSVASENNICDLLKKYAFISDELINKYFSEYKESLPNQQEIGDKYGLSKSGVSKKISRFFEKIDFS